MRKIILGSKVRDWESGVEGIAVTRAEYLNGCVRYGVQPPMGKDGKVPDTEYVDEEQLEVIERPAVAKAQAPKAQVKKIPPGGPSAYDPKGGSHGQPKR